MLLLDGSVGRGGGTVEGDFMERLCSGEYQADHEKRVGKMLEDIARLEDGTVRRG